MNEKKNENTKVEHKSVKRSFKAIGSMFVVLAILAMSLVCCFADGAAAGAGSSGEAVSAVSTVLKNVTDTVNISSVVQILGIGIGASIGLVLMWFGVRLVIRKVMGATRKGKV